MIVLFQVLRGTGAGRRIQLRGGQRATFGGTDHADYCFADNRDFQPVHFAIDCGGGRCRLVARPDGITSVNDKPVSDCELKTGDLIRVGQTVFSVTVEGAMATEPEAVVAPPPPSAEVVASAMTLVELWDYLELEPESRSIAEKHNEVESLIDELVQSKQYYPAIRLRANSLENIHAVWWGCANLRSLESLLELTPSDQIALAAAENFVMEPSDQSRRQAGTASEAATDGPAGMVAFAAFASGGSIGHPDVEPVEPDERLCGTILAGAMLLAGYSDPIKSHALISEMVANGKAPWKSQFRLPV